MEKIEIQVALHQNPQSSFLALLIRIKDKKASLEFILTHKESGCNWSGDRPGGALERLFFGPTRPALPASAAAASSSPMAAAAAAPPAGSAGTRESM